MKCVGTRISGAGPPWAHEAGGAPCRGGRTLGPRGQVPASPVVFSVLDILKYSRKNHINLARHLENFYFRDIFYCMDNSENRQKLLFLLYLI